MRLPICHFFLDFEGLPEEDFEVEGGLACESLWRMQGIMNALYEYLSDSAVIGAEAITVQGHRHGRAAFDGRYVMRSGSAQAAWLPHQSTSASSGTANFEVLDYATPQAGGETPGQPLLVDAICFFCRRDYLALTYSCRARASDVATSAYVRMKICSTSGHVLAFDECAVDGIDWTACAMQCELPDDEAFEGWLIMKLDFGVVSGNGSVELCAADRWCGGGHGAAAEITMH